MNRRDNIKSLGYSELNNLLTLFLILLTISELDLDYLERGGGGTLTTGGAPSVEPSPESLDLVKVVLLGAPAVGKTSIIQVYTLLIVFLISRKILSQEFPKKKKHVAEDLSISVRFRVREIVTETSARLICISSI